MDYVPTASNFLLIGFVNLSGVPGNVIPMLYALMRFPSIHTDGLPYIGGSHRKLQLSHSEHSSVRQGGRFQIKPKSKYPESKSVGTLSHDPNGAISGSNGSDSQSLG